MQCVKCKYPRTRLVKIVQSEDNSRTTRRRECLRCGKRFTTEENIRNPIKPLTDDRFHKANRE
jgi:transcriptional repressor NrdR